MTYCIGLFASFKNTVDYLPGVEIDKINLINYCMNTGRRLVMLCDDEVSLTNLENIFISNESMCEIIWFSGHGNYINDVNLFLTKITNNSINGEQFENFLSFNNRAVQKKGDVTMCIFDMCHSGTFFNLPYEFNFLTRQIEQTSHITEQDLRLPDIITISACSDDDVEDDSPTGGGLLSSHIFSYISPTRNNTRMLDLIIYLYSVNNKVKVYLSNININLSRIFL